MSSRSSSLAPGARPGQRWSDPTNGGSCRTRTARVSWVPARGNERQDAHRGVEALLALKDSVDDLMLRRGWECRLIAKVHFGTVIAGPFGAAGDKRPDV